jgi:hypothetical protein
MVHSVGAHILFLAPLCDGPTITNPDSSSQYMYSILLSFRLDMNSALMLHGTIMQLHAGTLVVVHSSYSCGEGRIGPFAQRPPILAASPGRERVLLVRCEEKQRKSEGWAKFKVGKPLGICQGHARIHFSSDCAL